MADAPLTFAGVIMVSVAMSFLIGQVLLRAFLFLMGIRWSDLHPKVREVRVPIKPATRYRP